MWSLAKAFLYFCQLSRGYLVVCDIIVFVYFVPLFSVLIFYPEALRWNFSDKSSELPMPHALA
jgi:hypothetical protein